MNDYLADTIDDKIARAVSEWAEKHPEPTKPFLAFLAGGRPLSPIDMAHAIENRTIDGRMQLQVFHHFIERHKPDGLERLLTMLDDTNPNQSAF